MIKQFIYSNNIPKEVGFFTNGKKYEVIERFNDYKGGTEYQVRVKGDDGRVYGPLNIGRGCAYLNDGMWIVENEGDADKKVDTLEETE